VVGEDGNGDVQHDRWWHGWSLGNAGVGDLASDGVSRDGTLTVASHRRHARNNDPNDVGDAGRGRSERGWTREDDQPEDEPTLTGTEHHRRDHHLHQPWIQQRQLSLVHLRPARRWHCPHHHWPRDGLRLLPRSREGVHGLQHSPRGPTGPPTATTCGLPPKPTSPWNPLHGGPDSCRCQRSAWARACHRAAASACRSCRSPFQPPPPHPPPAPVAAVAHFAAASLASSPSPGAAATSMQPAPHQPQPSPSDNIEGVHQTPSLAWARCPSGVGKSTPTLLRSMLLLRLQRYGVGAVGRGAVGLWRACGKVEMARTLFVMVVTTAGLGAGEDSAVGLQAGWTPGWMAGREGGRKRGWDAAWQRGRLAQMIDVHLRQCAAKQNLLRWD
jgi:hypothetical protein